MKYILFFLVISFSASAQNDENRYYYFNEFISAPTTTGGGSDLQTTTSTGTVTAIEAQDKGNIGLLQLTTGASATGMAAINSMSSAVLLGGGEWTYTVKIDSLLALCSATESYAVMCGFFDAFTQHNQVDGVFFLYDSMAVSTGTGVASSDKWQTVTTSANTREYYTTSSTVAATTGTELKIVIAADATSAEFFINGTSARTQTANIPTHATGQTAFGVMIIKSAGTTARWVWLDWIKTECRFNAPR